MQVVKVLTAIISTHSRTLRKLFSHVTSYKSKTPSALLKYDFAILRNLLGKKKTCVRLRSYIAECSRVDYTATFEKKKKNEAINFQELTPGINSSVIIIFSLNTAQSI